MRIKEQETHLTLQEHDDDDEPPHDSSRLTAHHQEVLLCIQQLVYVMRYVDWLVAGSGWNSIPILPTASKHKRMTYTNFCIYIVLPPDDDQ